MGRRVLITGLDTFWGGRMAQALEHEPDVEMILGLGANLILVFPSSGDNGGARQGKVTTLTAADASCIARRP